LDIGLSQPLVASQASSSAPSASVLTIEPKDVLALTLKSSEDGKAWIVRLFGASGEERKAKLQWSTPAAPRLWLSDLSEKSIEPVEGEITVPGWELITVRADRV
jgi:alpha-mannosidase